MKSIYDFCLPSVAVVVICSLLYLFVVSCNDWFYSGADGSRISTVEPDEYTEVEKWAITNSHAHWLKEK